LLVALVSPSVNAAVDVTTLEIEECDLLFDHRADLAKARKAAECYFDFVLNSRADRDLRQSAYANAFLSLTRVFTHSPRTLDQKKAVRLAMNIVRTFQSDEPESAFGNYWKAVFLSLDCRLRDQGRVIPTCILGRKGNIISLLKKAIRTGPS